jgi:hypothetical protein
MKITVKYEVSETRTDETWDLEDIGFSEEQWEEMDSEEKNQALTDIMDNKQPYWMVDYFREIKD